MKSKRLPYWKLKREIRRLGRQCRYDLPAWFMDRWAYTKYLYFSSYITQFTDGKLLPTDKVVIFLVFPQHGIQHSHIRMLQYFVENGFSPLVVSNLPLSESDLKMLSPVAWKIIQRENFGYDFGGYREGILYLKNRLSSIDELVLANDSVWYPLGEGQDFLDQARNSGKHFFGTVSCHGSKNRVYLEEFYDVDWQWDNNGKQYHVASFLLWLHSDLFRDSRFLKFWKKIRVTSDKHKTVRRGEIGLTKFVHKHGFSSGTAIDLAKFDEAIQALNNDELKDVLASIAPDLADEKMEIIADQIGKFNQEESWRLEAQKIILAIATRHHVAYFSSLLLLKHLDANFLKKALFPKTKESAEKIYQLLDSHPEFFPEDTANEIRATFEQTHTN